MEDIVMKIRLSISSFNLSSLQQRNVSVNYYSLVLRRFCKNIFYKYMEDQECFFI